MSQGEVGRGMILGGGKRKKEPDFFPETYANVRLAGTSVNMGFIHPHPEEQRGMDLATMPQPMSGRAKNPTSPPSSYIPSFHRAGERLSLRSVRGWEGAVQKGCLRKTGDWLPSKCLDLDLYLLEKQMLNKSQAHKLIKTHQRHRL